MYVLFMYHESISILHSAICDGKLWLLNGFHVLIMKSRSLFIISEIIERCTWVYFILVMRSHLFTQFCHTMCLIFGVIILFLSELIFTIFLPRLLTFFNKVFPFSIALCECQISINRFFAGSKKQVTVALFWYFYS